MGTWENYLHEDAPDRLVQLAVLHAEFEALHPFLDGNGRLGRLLVPLFLWQHDLIRAPMFYISAWFEARRDAYYERLLAVSRDDDWTGWCRFFLQAVQEQAEENLAKAEGILGLYDGMKLRMPTLTRSRYAIHALDWVFRYPIFRSTDFVRPRRRPGQDRPATSRSDVRRGSRETHSPRERASPDGFLLRRCVENRRRARVLMDTYGTQPVLWDTKTFHGHL